MALPGFLGRDSRRSDLSDEGLMALVRDGDTKAFAVVFDRHSGPAYALAYRMCGRAPLAEEIVQESFLSIWRASASYDGSRGTVRSWILGTVRNRTVDAFRRDASKESKTVHDDGISERIESAERVDSTVEARDQASRVRGALGTLPDDQRRVIELAYFGGYSHSEIADLLTLPAGTVKGRMRLGMAKLRIELGDLAGALS